MFSVYRTALESGDHWQEVRAMFYVVHVVKRYVAGVMMVDHEGEWILEKFDDLTLADMRCQQLNEGINLSEHHWYEIRENVEGLSKSELCDF